MLGLQRHSSKPLNALLTLVLFAGFELTATSSMHLSRNEVSSRNVYVTFPPTQETLAKHFGSAPRSVTGSIVDHGEPRAGRLFPQSFMTRCSKPTWPTYKAFGVGSCRPLKLIAEFDSNVYSSLHGLSSVPRCMFARVCFLFAQVQCVYGTLWIWSPLDSLNDSPYMYLPFGKGSARAWGGGKLHTPLFERADAMAKC